MPWRDETIPMLRVIINDMSFSPAYSDERLEQILIVAAKLIDQEFDFDTDYTISIEDPSISPDPIDEDDRVFVNMMVLKAACLADQSTYRTKANVEGIKAALGPASLTVAGNLAGFKTLLEKGPCASYTEMKDSLIWGNINIVRAVLSPFAGNLFRGPETRDYNNR